MNNLRAITARVALAAFLLACVPTLRAADPAPLRLAIAGLVHGHIHGFLLRAVADPNTEVVGIYEPNKALHRKYAPMAPSVVFYTDLDAMLDKRKPEAVAIFSSTYDHTALVERIAPRGIDVMMEKPLAVNLAHGRRIASAADEHGINVLVNYETTWYPTHHEIKRRVDAGEIGAIRRFVVRDGHPGPVKIGVPDEFLEWLIDLRANGAGALTDFGCYGANLITWILDNQRPLTVTAVTQTLQPELYPEVDDEATIVVTYPGTVGVIEASWNWTHSRKDMDVYGLNGALRARDRARLVAHPVGGEAVDSRPPPLEAPHDTSLHYLRAVVRGEIEPSGLSSLANNMIVTEILDAAIRSANAGQTIHLPRD